MSPERNAKKKKKKRFKSAFRRNKESLTSPNIINQAGDRSPLTVAPRVVQVDDYTDKQDYHQKSYIKKVKKNKNLMSS